MRLSSMHCFERGSRTARFANPVRKMVAIGKNVPQRFDESRRALMPDEAPKGVLLPGRVMARTSGKAVCRPK